MVFAERLRLWPAGCFVCADGGGGIIGYAVSHPWRRDDAPALDALLGKPYRGRPEVAVAALHAALEQLSPLELFDASEVEGALRDFTVNVADPIALPADWRVWGAPQALVLRQADYLQLDLERRTALRRWVADLRSARTTLPHPATE